MHFVGPTDCTRRAFLRYTILSLGITFGATSSSRFAALAAAPESFKGEYVFHRIMDGALAGNWSALPVGELIGKIARELEGTPYVAGTLDRSSDLETCSIDLTGLDCVTFFETTLGFARMLKKGGSTPADLLNEVRFTRYRGGQQGDYSSRLHYTTDWFVDNEEKGVVKILSQLPGAEPFVQKVGFMTSHPERYKALAAHPELLEKIKSCETAINRRVLKFIPLSKLSAVEALLQTGDIVAVCTSQPGIDITHTGLILRDANGVAHFMDASSGKAKMKVTIEPGPISETLNWSKAITGAMFARPQEPRQLVP
jgi:hypothetical protein